MFESFLQKYSIEVVVNRTKISRRNLEKLAAGNFEELTRPQAMGFVKILQREFGDEDFTPLQKEVEAWFENLPETHSEPIFHPGEEHGGGNKRWLVVVLLAVAVLFGYYLYRSEFASESVSRQPRATQEPIQVPAVTPDHRTPGTTGHTPNGTETSPVGGVAEGEGNGSIDAQAAETSSAVPKSAVSKESAEISKPYVPLEPVLVEPTVKLWLGIIDLTTKKRVAKVTDRPYEIDAHGRKLVLTGHGRFEISDAFGNLFKYNDAKKHYFLIDDGLVKEIDASEFKRLNGGRLW